MPKWTSLLTVLGLFFGVAGALADSPEAGSTDLDRSSLAPAVATPPGQVLLPRVQNTLPADGMRPLLPPPAKIAPADPTAEADDGRRLDVRLQSFDLIAPAAPEALLGHRRNVVVSLPLGQALDLRTGVRMSYESGPTSQAHDLDGTPTFGFGLRF